LFLSAAQTRTPPKRKKGKRLFKIFNLRLRLTRPTESEIIDLFWIDMGDGDVTAIKAEFFFGTGFGPVNSSPGSSNRLTKNQLF